MRIGSGLVCLLGLGQFGAGLLQLLVERGLVGQQRGKLLIAVGQIRRQAMQFLERVLWRRP